MAAIRIWVSPTSVTVHQHQKKQSPAPVKRSCSTTTTTTTSTNTRRRTMIVAQSTTTPADISLQSTPLLQIRSSIKLHKVFEDRSSGIVCYRDDEGEITCEGYDEGPRFHHRVSRFACNQRDRDAEVIDLLQRRLLQIVDNDAKTKMN